MDFEFIQNNQRKVKNILSFIIEQRQQQILKRVKAIRQTKAYIHFKECGTLKAFDIARTDFNSCAFELKSLQYEFNVLQEIQGKSYLNILVSLESDYIKMLEMGV